MALLFGASLLLGGLLTAVPREVPGVAIATVLGGAWLSLVLALTLPGEAERAGEEMARRLALFRHDLHAIGDEPTREQLERLLEHARELGLQEEEIHDELAQIRAALEALDVRARIARGELPVVAAPEPLPAGDTCHFLCPVRFGRRKTDQFGHLMLTAGWLKFRGVLDVSVAWTQVAEVRRDGREIIVAMQDSRRLLRFACGSLSEAATGGAIAQHLLHVALLERSSSGEYQAI